MIHLCRRLGLLRSRLGLALLLGTIRFWAITTLGLGVTYARRRRAALLCRTTALLILFFILCRAGGLGLGKRKEMTNLTKWTHNGAPFTWLDDRLRARTASPASDSSEDSALPAVDLISELDLLRLGLVSAGGATGPLASIDSLRASRRDDILHSRESALAIRGSTPKKVALLVDQSRRVVKR